MNARRYATVAGALFLLDWALGMAHVRGLLPLQSFLILNFPCGIPYAWIESHWAGTRYVVDGRTISEFWSLGSFCFMVLGQAWVYSLLMFARPPKRDVSGKA